jgi:TIR domain
MKPKYDAFISYNSRDAKSAEKLATKLRDAGIHVWFDPWSHRPGDSFSAVSEAIDATTAFLILIGLGGIEGPWHATEIETPFERAARLDYRIIPVLLPGAKPTLMPSFLRTRIYVDLRKWDESQFSRLAESLRGDPKVFLCHAKEDERRIQKIYRYLKRRGLEAWFDKANLKTGDVWKEEIYQAIERTDFFLVCLSSPSFLLRVCCDA